MNRIIFKHMQLVLLVSGEIHQRGLHLIIRLKLDTGNSSCFIFQHGKSYIETQLVYLIDIFEDIYKIVRVVSK